MAPLSESKSDALPLGDVPVLRIRRRGRAQPPAFFGRPVCLRFRVWFVPDIYVGHECRRGFSPRMRRFTTMRSAYLLRCSGERLHIPSRHKSRPVVWCLRAAFGYGGRGRGSASDPLQLHGIAPAVLPLSRPYDREKPPGGVVSFLTVLAIIKHTTGICPFMSPVIPLYPLLSHSIPLARKWDKQKRGRPLGIFLSLSHFLTHARIWDKQKEGTRSGCPSLLVVYCFFFMSSRISALIYACTDSPLSLSCSMCSRISSSVP